MCASVIIRALISALFVIILASGGSTLVDGVVADVFGTIENGSLLISCLFSLVPERNTLLSRNSAMLTAEQVF